LHLSRWLSRRHFNHKAAPCACFALDGDAPAMGLDDASHNGQAQAAAIDTVTLALVESFKDAFLLGRGDAGAAILHPQSHAIALASLLGANLHSPASGGEL